MQQCNTLLRSAVRDSNFEAPVETFYGFSFFATFDDVVSFWYLICILQRDKNFTPKSLMRPDLFTPLKRYYSGISSILSIEIVPNLI